MNWNNKKPGRELNVRFDDGAVTFTDKVNGDTVEVFIDPAKVWDMAYRIGEGPVTREPALIVVVGDHLTLRDVYHFTTKAECERLRVGVTLHRGPFSSLPHEFEKSPVTGFEEAFYVMTPGKGLLEGQGLLDDVMVDTAWPLRGGDLIQVPMGWHRVTALPNEDSSIPPFAYVWGYLAKYPGWEKV